MSLRSSAEFIFLSAQVIKVLESRKVIAACFHYGFILLNVSLFFFSIKGINAERKEAKAEKEEAEKYQKLTQDLVSCSVF